jgi:outer membrane protein TolC
VPIVAPTLWKAIKISDTQILQNLEAARSSRLELANQINQAYYSLLLAIASHKVVLENYEVAKLNADTYEKQFAVGTATEYDVLRSSVQVKNVEPELLQAEIAIKQCKLQLKVLMGMDASVNIEPNVTLKELQSEMYGYVAEVSDRSLTDNSSLRTLDLQKRLAEQNVDLKKMEFLPTIGASFTLNWNALSNGNALKNQEFNPYSNVAVSLSLPIFSGGSRYYGLKGAQLQVKEIELQRDYLLSSLNMQVDLAIDNINKEVRQIESSEESVRQAEKAHQIMQKSFEIGAATYLNLRDSELADTTAKLTYYQAIYNFLVSTSELDMLLGRESELRLAGYVPTSK